MNLDIKSITNNLIEFLSREIYGATTNKSGHRGESKIYYIKYKI